MNTTGLLKLLVLGIGVFAIFFPRSPLTLRLFRDFGPRTDVHSLLRSEIKENTRKLFGMANVCLVVFMVILLLMPEGRLSDDELKKWVTVLCVPGALGGLLLLTGLRSGVNYLRRKPGRDAELIRERLADIPISSCLEGKELRDWLAERGIKIPGPPPSNAGMKFVFEGFDLACLAGGGFMLLAGLGLLALAIAEWKKPNNRGLLTLSLGTLAFALVMIVAGIKMNRLRRK